MPNTSPGVKHHVAFREQDAKGGTERAKRQGHALGVPQKKRFGCASEDATRALGCASEHMLLEASFGCASQNAPRL